MMTQRTATEGHADAAQQARQGIDRLARQLRNLASPADMITNSALTQAEVRRPQPALRHGLQGRRRRRADVRAQPRERAPRALLPADERLDPRRRRGHHRARRAVGADPAHLGRDADPARGPAAGGELPGPGWDDQRRVADYLVNASDRRPIRSSATRVPPARSPPPTTPRASRSSASRPTCTSTPIPRSARSRRTSRARSSCATRTARRAPSSATSSRTRSPARCSSTAPAPRTPRTSG